MKDDAFKELKLLEKFAKISNTIDHKQKRKLIRQLTPIEDKALTTYWESSLDRYSKNNGAIIINNFSLSETIEILDFFISNGIPVYYSEKSTIALDIVYHALEKGYSLELSQLIIERFGETKTVAAIKFS